MAATAFSWLKVPTWGRGTTRHRAPSQCSISVCRGLLISEESPTAQILLLERAVTPFSWLAVPTLGLETIFQASGPHPEAAATPPVLMSRVKRTNVNKKETKGVFKRFMIYLSISFDRVKYL